MTEEKNEKLKMTAYKVRQHIIRMSTNGGCFIGASLSCADILVYLYECFLNINGNNMESGDRDMFFLSKGHDVPALYGTLVETGLLEEERLKNHLQTNDFIYWHPNTKIPGVEFHSGSLGHLLSVAMGAAYDFKLREKKNKVVVLLGDGELNEGSVWEALLVASSLKLDNLIVIVDRNMFQANKETEQLIRLEPLQDKFLTFGCDVKYVYGHDFEELEKALSANKHRSGNPFVIIARTIRGRGLSSIEARADRWFVNFTGEEALMLLEELKTGAKPELTSESLMVR
ncbi:MAG: transketolase [Bacteroidetes bacterium]|nr:transketolase [Bacteroidota bacterium]